MRITLCDSYRSYITDHFQQHDVSYFDQSLTTPEEFREQIAGADVLGVRWPIRSFRITREMIEQLPRLQFIHATGTGTDWFDVEELTEQGIILANNHGFNAANVAEHALSLILLALRNTHWYIDSVRQGKWRSTSPPTDISSLRGKTIGIIGMGQSGAYLAKSMLGLGARVIAYQRRQPPEIEILGEIEWKTYHDLLRESDIVSLHVPLTAETTGMIGQQELELMKPSAVLINCARGAVVDEEALHNVMSRGHLRAAALDVFAHEPAPREHPLLSLENVIATPHISGQSMENVDVQVEGTLDNIERFVAGQRPHRIANPTVLARPSLRARHLRVSE